MAVSFVSQFYLCSKNILETMSWFRKKSRVERLKIRYTYLMRRSYETSLKNAEKSESLHRQAVKLFQEINYLSLQQGDK